jgi:hypothetical protein
MGAKRFATLGLVLAIALAGLMSGRTQAAEGKGTPLGRFISPDFCGALVIHPLRIQQSTLAEAIKSALPKDSPAATALPLGLLQGQKNLPPGMDVEKLNKLIDPKTIHRVVVLIDPLAAPGADASPGIIVQFNADVDGAAILAAVAKDWQPGESAGTKYQKTKNPKAGQPDMAACVVDSRTIIAGLEVTLVKMLADNQSGSQPLLEQLKHTSLNNDIVVEFLAEPLIAKVAKATGKTADQVLAGAGDPSMAMMAKEVKSVSVALNFSGATLLHAEVATGKDEAAAGLAMLANMGVATGKQKYEEFKKTPSPLLPPPLTEALFKVGDEIFAGLTVKAEAARTVANLPMPASLPDALKTVTQIGSTMLQGMAASAGGGLSGPAGGTPAPATAPATPSK